VKPAEKKLRQQRQALLEQMASMSLVVQGSYLERLSLCGRPNCARRRGEKHGPRSCLVIYQDKKQRQVYVPQAQRDSILRGLDQHRKLLAIVKEITRINLQLTRAGQLIAPGTRPSKKGTRHE
jgi:hypothetical protein